MKLVLSIGALIVLAPVFGMGQQPRSNFVTQTPQYALSPNRKQVLFGTGLKIDLSGFLPEAFFKSGYFQQTRNGKMYFTVEYYEKGSQHHTWVCDATKIRGNEKTLYDADGGIVPHSGNCFYIANPSTAVPVSCFGPNEPEFYIQCVSPRAVQNSIVAMYRYNRGPTRIRVYNVRTLAIQRDLAITDFPLLEADAVDWLKGDAVMVRERSRMAIGYTVLSSTTGNGLATAASSLTRTTSNGVFARPMMVGKNYANPPQPYLFFEYSK